MVELRLLGTLQLTASDGRDLTALARQSKRTALLLYLAAAVPYGLHRRDTLLALFWPELDEAKARSALSQALYVLRNALGEQAIVTRGDDEVGISSLVVWCDVHAFETALDAGQFAEALALYHRGLLNGFSLGDAPEFGRWVDQERERLRERAADGAWALAEERTAGKDPIQAARWARWAAALAPADEAVIRHLMTFLRGLGDRAAALRAYEAFAFRLTEEYDLEPSAETRAFAEAMRYEKPTVVAPAPGERSPAGGPAPGLDLRGPRRSRPLVPVLMLVALVTALGFGVVAQHRSATVSTLRRIAVLPLDNLTGDTAQGYFVEGMHNALVTELAKIGALSVISRNSVMRYRNSTKGVPEIARELHVDAVVVGSVVLAGDSVRIDAQLVEASTDKHLWADTFVKSRRHVLALYADVTRAIAEHVHAVLTPGEVARLGHAPPVNPAAYETLLRAEFRLSRRTGPDLEACIRYADQAIAIEPVYARAYAIKARCYDLITYYAPAAPGPSFGQAKLAARKALELDETVAEAHIALGWALATNEWDWSAADRELRRGLELEPHSGAGHATYAFFLSWLGRQEEAIVEAHRADELEPLVPSVAQNVAVVLYDGRRFDEAVVQARRAIEMDSTFFVAYMRLGLAYAGQGKYPEAVAALERSVHLAPGYVRQKGFLGYMYARAGRTADARKILNELLVVEQRTYVPPTSIAILYLGLDRREDAIRWLDRGYASRDGDMVLLKVWPILDPLRGEPRFQALLGRMRFPMEPSRRVSAGTLP